MVIPPIKLYLASYSVVSSLLWASILFEGVHHLARNASPLDFWTSSKDRLLFTQHLALLEILHSALGFVSSPLLSTTIQVLSRVAMLDLFTLQAPDCKKDFSLYLMVMSWSLVEVPRYAFYAFQALNVEVPYALFFLRYSFFMILYPTGISGEVLQQVASYPHWKREGLEVMTRLSHVLIGGMYVPLGPFMIWNMWMMRKRAFKKRAENEKAATAVAPEGLIWPITNEKNKERSTTDTGKKIFAAAARGEASAKGEKVAKSVEREKNWRFGYVKHIAAHVALSCESPDAAVNVAQAGLNAAHSMFKYSEGGKEIAFEQAMKSPSTAKTFYSARLNGKSFGTPVEHTLKVPYKAKTLTGKELVSQLDKWASKGTIEPTAADAIRICSENAKSWMDLSDVLFVMLGATSAMGPLDNLLSHGATVVAIDLKRPQIWEKLFQRVEASRGAIIYPVAKPDLTSTKELMDNAGCDMLRDTLAICNWIDTVVDANPGKKIVCGNYTYLDGALHVQLAIAGDAIMQRLCTKHKTTALAFLCTPTDDHVVPRESREAAQKAFKNAKWWQRLLTALGALTPNFALPEANGFCIVDAIVGRQGPNYAMAKRIQHWRAIVARSQGHIVSSNVAPSTATQSVISNPQFAAGYAGWRHFSPLEVFLQETSGAVMFALLIHDLRNPQSKSHPSVKLANPLELFSLQSFHGGIWRCAFSIDSVGVPAAASFYLQKYAPHGVGALAVVSGAVSYIIKGKIVPV